MPKDNPLAPLYQRAGEAGTRAELISEGDKVQNVRAGSSRNGWVGIVRRIKKTDRGLVIFVEWTGKGLDWQEYLAENSHNNLLKIKGKGMNGEAKGKFIVWCPTKGNPTKRHENPFEATTEAERLAKLHPGHDFYVALLKSITTTSTVTTRGL